MLSPTTPAWYVSLDSLQVGTCLSVYRSSTAVATVAYFDLLLSLTPFPGQYYLRPMMKEHRFSVVSSDSAGTDPRPNVAIPVDVVEGVSVHVKIVAERTAFSVSGLVSEISYCHIHLVERKLDASHVHRCWFISSSTAAYLYLPTSRYSRWLAFPRLTSWSRRNGCLSPWPAHSGYSRRPS